VHAHFKVLRAIENREPRTVEAAFAELVIGRGVVLTEFAWSRWSFPETIEALVTVQNAPWILGQDARYYFSTRALLLKALQRFDFSNHPKPWAVIEKAHFDGPFD